MSNHDPALPVRDPLPRHTTPTWEMELLISGATVFALLQLPAALDAGLYALFPRFDRAAAMLILLPCVYIKSAAYALIFTFVLHLATRGYWVALVGLRSVYPAGIRWEGLKWGPHYLGAIRERLGSTDALVERADNRASQVFGFGVGFALLMLAPLLIMIVVTLLAYAIHYLLGERYDWLILWHLLFAILFLPFGLAVLVDRMVGKRFEPGSRMAGGLRRFFLACLRGGFSSFTNYPMVMFLGQFGQRRGGVLLSVAIVLVVMISVAQMMWNDGSGIGNYRHLGTEEIGHERTLNPAHYADQRGDGATLTPLPFITSEVVRGDYLRVFIPYRPGRDNPALDESCPQATQVGADEASSVVLDCLALLYPLALDGVTVADPRFDRAQDPVSGLRGVVAMLRIADLAPGRHLLEVARPGAPQRSADEADEPPYRIPFWR